MKQAAETSPGRVNRYRFSVALKGNLMVAVPLLFMVAFTAVLTGEINQAEISREKLSADRELLTLATRMGYIYQRAFASVYFISLLGIDDPRVMERLTRRYNPMIKALLNCSAELKNRVRTNTSLRVEDAFALEKYVKEIVALMDAAVYRIPKEQRFGYLTVQRDTFLAIGAKLDAVIGPLRKADSESPAIMTRLYNRILGTMQTGVVASIILALGLSGYFSADISRRVKKLAENVRRFSAGEDLSPGSGGADEIAELDLSFRAAVGQLREADETKKRFFTAVTRDLEMPIERIQQVVAGLLAGEHGELNAGTRTRLTTARNNLNRITLLVQDLEDVEQLETGKLPLSKSYTSVESLLVKSRQMLESAALAKKLSIKIECADFQLYADEKRLGQIMSNFLSNAIKYSPEGSAITLRCKAGSQEARFEVQDQGPGIEPGAQSRLFQKFQQVSLRDARRGTGTGLGLSVSKLIAECHGGRVGVESTPGAGSTFWFAVPLETAEETSGQGRQS